MSTPDFMDISRVVYAFGFSKGVLQFSVVYLNLEYAYLNSGEETQETDLRSFIELSDSDQVYGVFGIKQYRFFTAICPDKKFFDVLPPIYYPLWPDYYDEYVLEAEQLLEEGKRIGYFKEILLIQKALEPELSTSSEPDVWRVMQKWERKDAKLKIEMKNETFKIKSVNRKLKKTHFPDKSLR